MAVRLLLLDNHDSFTYNLAQAFEGLGATVMVRLSDAIDVEEAWRTGPTHVVISPGPGRPCGAGISRDAVRGFAGRLPLLGVCLGHQALAEVYGARVVHAPELVHGKATPVLHDGQGLFRGLPSPFRAARYHSLVVDAASLPTDLRVTARTPDGLVMGLEHRSLALHGVQFHPESFMTAVGPRLLRNFLELAPEPAQLRP